MKRILSILTIMSFVTVSAMASLTDGLVAHYEFEGNANDSSGNGNNATEYGGVSYTTGKIGQAASFDGIDDYVKTNNISDSWDHWTVSAFIHMDSFESGKQYEIIEREQLGGGVNDFEFMVEQTGKIRTETDNTSPSHTTTSSSIINTGQWYHITTSYDGNNIKIYINGILETNEARSNGKITVNEPIMIAKHVNPSYPSYFNGKIDDLRIYNRALSNSEIQELYEYDKNTCSGVYTQADLDAQYEAGKAYCQANPSACGISTGGGSSSWTGTTPVSTVVNAVQGKSHDINGHYIHYADGSFDWIYVDSAGKSISKLEEGCTETGGLRWTTIHTPNNENFSYIDVSDDGKSIAIGGPNPGQ